MWNHKLWSASAFSKEGNAHHWIVTVRIKAKTPTPLRPETISLFTKDESAKRCQTTLEWPWKHVSETDLFLIITCSNAQGSHRCILRLLRLLLESQRKMQEVEGLGLLKIPAFNSYLFLGWGKNGSIPIMLQMTPFSLKMAKKKPFTLSIWLLEKQQNSVESCELYYRWEESVYSPP